MIRQFIMADFPKWQFVIIWHCWLPVMIFIWDSRIDGSGDRHDVIFSNLYNMDSDLLEKFDSRSFHYPFLMLIMRSNMTHE